MGKLNETIRKDIEYLIVMPIRPRSTPMKIMTQQAKYVLQVSITWNLGHLLFYLYKAPAENR